MTGTPTPPQAAQRAIQVRLPGDLAEDLKIISWVDRRPQVDIIRDALTTYLTNAGHPPGPVAS